ncbi:hypothetical protein GW17_00038879 [Ensete ventricosum]|nr:hypothetical protein GW17_00038879 [Ensete ventricosum]
MYWFACYSISGTIVGGCLINDQKNLEGRSPIRNAWIASMGWVLGIPRISTNIAPGYVKHNGVRATSTRGAQREVVRGERVQMLSSGCHFDAGPSDDLAELFLQDKTFARVVGSGGGPSDNQVSIVSKGEV